MKYLKKIFLVLVVLLAFSTTVGASDVDGNIANQLYVLNSNKDIIINFYSNMDKLNSVKVNNTTINKVVEKTGDYKIDYDKKNVTIKHEYLNDLGEGIYNLTFNYKNKNYVSILSILDCSQEGSCNKLNDNIYYRYDSNTKTLNIKGINKLYYYSSKPWANYDIEKLIIDEGITVIGEGFFSDLNITDIVFPSSLKEIKRNAFLNCDRKNINIPSNIEVDEYAFKKKYEIDHQLYILGSKEDIVVNLNNNIDKFTDIKNDNNKLTKMESKDSTDGDYLIDQENKTITIKSSYLEKLSSGVHHLDFIFDDGDSHNILSVLDCSQEGSCNSCGEKAYWSYDSNKKLLTIKGVGITEHALNNYHNKNKKIPWVDLDVDKVVVEEGITELNHGFFMGSTLKSIDLPNTLTTIDSIVFEDCKRLESIDIPDSVTTISNFIFSNNKKLKHVKLSKNISDMGISNFSNCSSLEEIDIPEKISILELSSVPNLKKVFLHSDAPETNYNSSPFDTNMNELLFRVYVPYGSNNYDKSFWTDYNITGYNEVNKNKDYNAIINDGIGSYDYDEGDIVTITANPPHGKQFVSWRVDKGNVTLKDIYNPIQTFVMPSEDVEVSALYENEHSIGEDNIAPSVTDVRILKNEIYKPGIVYVELDVIEEDSGISSVYVGIKKDGEVGRWGAYDNDDVYYTGTIKLPISVDSKTKNGKWYLTEITLYDNKNNVRNYYIIEDDEKYYLSEYNSNNMGYVYYKELSSAYYVVKDEYNISLDTALSNPNLVDRIKALKDNESARIMIDNTSIIKKDVFDAIKGTNKTIIVYKDAIEWVFKGNEIVNETKDIDTALEISEVSGTSFGSDKNIVKLSFKPNGLLPGLANIRIKSDYLYRLKGITGNLYLYYDLGDELTQEEEDLELILDGSDKWVSFSVSHNSKYYISGKKIKRKPTVRKAIVTGISNKIYKGSSQKPTPTVKLSGKKLKINKDFTVKYKNNKNVGIATITIKGKGKYIGTYTKEFIIKPKATSVSKLKTGKGYIKVYWKKMTTQTTGYEIDYSTDKKFKSDVEKITITKNKTTSKKIGNLLNKKKYYVRVRTYKIVKGVTYYSKWSSVKSIKTK